MGYEDLTGRVFSRLTVIDCVGKLKGNRYTWLCKCQCGKETLVRAFQLKGGRTKSCGCLSLEATKKANTKHGCATRTKGLNRAYISWAKCKMRCRNAKANEYKLYGGVGIDMCDDWYNSFEAFYRDMGDCPDNMTLDRLDNTKGYEPGNCRWATGIEQANNKRNNLIAETNIGIMTLAEITRYLALAPHKGNASRTQGYKQLKKKIQTALKVRGDNYYPPTIKERG